MRRIGVVLLVLMLGIGSFGQVTITFWHAMSGALGEALTYLVQKFQGENPDVVVDLVYQGGYSALQQKLIAAVAAGQPPTLAQQYENWTTQWLDALVDLDLFLPEEVLADILPSFEQVFDGRIVTVPFNKSILVLYYRPDLVPNPPKTWAEFEQLVCSIAKDVNGDGKLDEYGTAYRPPNPEIFLTFLTQAGGSILSGDWTEVTINNAAGIEAAEFAARTAKCALVQSAYISDAIQKGIVVGMWIDTSAGYTYNMNAAKTAGVPLAVAPVPCYKNCASMIQGTNLGIFSLNQSRAQIEAAARLIAFLLREDNIVYWAQKTGYLPVTRSAVFGDRWQSYIAEHREQKIMTDQLLAGGFGQLLHPKYMDIRNLLITYWELLLKGQGAPKELMDALAAEIKSVISK
ncbi:MAG: ABC transporter substrate-binding protein [Candidatus Bipolaricaulota bacterium]|nr:ABC transporter substrate-binding protein [Candidatus Bipolaricaulota bacterium]MDW8126643.1 ABC transporter substrate-binding protein [Candidatus Bipolaricaulota bacterium]